MDKPYLVYKNNLDDSTSACPANSDLAMYLYAEILKFNNKFKTNISFYSDEVLQGEILLQARKVIYLELSSLLDNYHVDADPNGFGRSAMKIEILGKERILNHFRNEIDQIIYWLNALLLFFDETIEGNGKVEIYGLGDIDVIDWHIVWNVKNIKRTMNVCTTDELTNQSKYLFEIDEILQRNPNEFNDRLSQLIKKKYLTVNDNFINVTGKGKVVGVWANYITKKITIEEPRKG